MSTEIAKRSVMGVSSWDEAIRVADCLSRSDIVPDGFRGKHANCLVALEIASRTGYGVMQVMQSLYVVKGKPAWSGQWMIAVVNGSGLYGRLNFHFSGTGDARACFAWAVRQADGKRVDGPAVSLEMAKAEKWGDKWRTMPELMLRYRAAAFFARTECPEVIMGMHTTDEIEDAAMSEMATDDIVAAPATISAADQYREQAAPILELMANPHCTLASAKSYHAQLATLLADHGLQSDERADRLLAAIQKEYDDAR